MARCERDVPRTVVLRGTIPSVAPVRGPWLRVVSVPLEARDVVLRALAVVLAADTTVRAVDASLVERRAGRRCRVAGSCAGREIGAVLIGRAVVATWVRGCGRGESDAQRSHDAEYSERLLHRSSLR